VWQPVAGKGRYQDRPQASGPCTGNVGEQLIADHRRLGGTKVEVAQRATKGGGPRLAHHRSSGNAKRTRYASHTGGPAVGNDRQADPGGAKRSRPGDHRWRREVGGRRQQRLVEIEQQSTEPVPGEARGGQLLDPVDAKIGPQGHERMVPGRPSTACRDAHVPAHVGARPTRFTMPAHQWERPRPRAAVGRTRQGGRSTGSGRHRAGRWWHRAGVPVPPRPDRERRCRRRFRTER